MSGKEQYDHLTHYRCPPLGGPVGFKHCRTVNDGLPCTKFPACWGRKLDALEFLRENYTEEEISKALATGGKTRLETIFGAIEKAKKNVEE